MTDFFSALFFIMFPVCIWGGVALARKWAKTTIARIFLALLLIVLFIVVGTVAIMAGCSALGGTVNFH
jgi:hypothetical protein